jgi:hypothetical protein
VLGHAAHKLVTAGALDHIDVVHHALDRHGDGEARLADGLQHGEGEVRVS